MDKKLKTYVLMIARHFPGDHPRKGEFTCFNSKILLKEKIHTIRKNYPLWEKRIREVMEFRAVLELRQWEGRPYHSKQILLTTLTAADGVGIQKVKFGYAAEIDGVQKSCKQLAGNDGLDFQDFRHWFKKTHPSDELAIIHFTPYRYDSAKHY